MYGSSAVCASILLVAAAAAQIQLLDLYEGDICQQENGKLWTCKSAKNCPRLREDIRKGKRPPICNFVGTDPVVCCEPDERPAVKPSKSKEMCKKYAESVYIKVPDEIGSGVKNYDTCSAVEPLILDGKDVAPREYPHMALIGYGKKEDPQWLCGGSLISERFVLSAAHCTQPSKGPAKYVLLGEHNKESKADDEQGLSLPTRYDIIERINHPDYREPSVYNDIALYRLHEDVQFNEYVRPICLQTDHQFAKTYAIATGWGRTEWGGRGSDILQKVNLTITSRKECSDAYREAIGPKLRNGITDESMLCAGDIYSTKDTCQGDSGGPLQLRLVDPYCMYSQVGVTSFGSKCGGNKPGVYTRVSHFVPWIESVVWP